jgi:tetratricopeptide (TPR) repeat protein
VLNLDQIEAIPGPGTLSWLPVRYTLGIRAFGCNAYRAAEAGQDVVEPHTEDPDLAHEELYFVAAGHATFTIDGQSHDAPAGTYVFIPDPASHRHAVADEPGTTVLSFGGPAAFEPSAWEWAFRAAGVQQTDPAKAREILEEGLRTHPNSPTLDYGMACLETLEGHHEEAITWLRQAIDLRPELKEWALKDSDLEALRDDPYFRSLSG